ncbi:MAG: thioredoxin family protein [Bacilli bacterium]
MIKELDLKLFNEWCLGDSVIVIYTRWCPVCKMLLFKLEEYSDEHPEIRIGKFEVSDHNLAEIGINSQNVPLTIINRANKPQEKIKGMFDLEDLEEIISH